MTIEPYFSGEENFSEGSAPVDATSTQPPADTSPAGVPPKPAEPSTLSVGDYGTFNAEQLKEFFGTFSTLKEQAKTWGDVQTERQKLDTERATMREAILLHNIAQNPEVRQLLEPYLQKATEGLARDPESGKFTGKRIGIEDPRMSDDLIRQAQEDHSFVQKLRESVWDAEIDKTWEGIKGQYGELVDDPFTQKVTDMALAREKQTGRPVEPFDLVQLAAMELVASGKLVELGKKQVLDELKKLPKGTEVLTGPGHATTPAQVAPKDYPWTQFEQDLSGAIG